MLFKRFLNQKNALTPEQSFAEGTLQVVCVFLGFCFSVERCAMNCLMMMVMMYDPVGVFGVDVFLNF